MFTNSIALLTEFFTKALSLTDDVRGGFAKFCAFVAIILLGVGLACGLFWIGGYVFAFVWNYSVPLLWAQAPVLDAWHAAALLVVGNHIGSCIGKGSVNTPEPKKVK